ncbi:hypothetical protein BJ742DRAFT_805809 [Cladochytrium replicatum]|nr:hypothetical protein BJ742DRAFT_805809 [Cladochytrium replicatum]
MNMDYLLLVTIHGFLGDGESFKHFPTDVANDLKSHGIKFEIENYAYPTSGDNSLRVRELTEFLLERPGRPTVIICHSMGGLLAADCIRAITSLKSSGTWGPSVQETVGADTPRSDAEYANGQIARVPGLEGEEDMNALRKRAKAVDVLGILAFDSPFFGLHAVVMEHGTARAAQTAERTMETVTSVMNSFGSRTASQVSRTATTASSSSWLSVVAGAAATLGVVAAASAAYKDPMIRKYVADKSTAVAEHLTFLGPLWRVGHQTARMEAIDTMVVQNQLSFRCFFLKLSTSQQSKSSSTFINMPPRNFERYFVPIEMTKPPDVIRAHTHLFDASGDSAAYVALLLATSEAIVEILRNRNIK